MRRPVFRADPAHALALFARAPTFELASTTPAGVPVLRTLHGVVVDGALAFHGSPVGEKLEIVGREAVAGVSETLASLPSHFTDGERACPATTLYDAAQAHGVVREITDVGRKARVLQALMEKLQPDGGHVPIDPAHPRWDELYRKPVAGIAIFELPLDRVDGKTKLLQHKTPETRARVIEALWRRGAPGDPRAIEAILRVSPPTERPAFLRGPGGLSLAIALGAGDAEAAADLAAGTYWNDVFTRDELVRAHEGSTAWVGAHEPTGRLVGTARAISDGAKHAWIYDVVVREELRGKGVGEALMRLLCDHPALRRARVLHLGTRDAMEFYRRLGFVEKTAIRRPYASIEMARVRTDAG